MFLFVIVAYIKRIHGNNLIFRGQGSGVSSPSEALAKGGGQRTEFRDQRSGNSVNVNVNESVNGNECNSFNTEDTETTPLRSSHPSAGSGQAECRRENPGVWGL